MEMGRILPDGRVKIVHEYERMDEMMALERQGTEHYSQGGRRVALTKIPEHNCEVSTVFLTFNHAWNGGFLWFESMVFGGVHSDDMERYATVGEAYIGHCQMVEKIVDGFNSE